jgi:Fe-S cluster biogenesis protein NfuA
MRAQIEEALERLRPSLRLDGGDVRLIDVSKDGVVRIGLTGVCAGCPMSRMLLQLGIEASLKDTPGVTKIETIDERNAID